MASFESQFVEYKQSLGELKSIIETVAAFASCEGGTIRIGIGPHGETLGVQIGRTTLEDLARDIKLNTDPPLFPSITFSGNEASAVITVQVDASAVKPVFAYGRPFQRVGRSNQRLSREEVQRLMEQTSGRTWDSLTCPGFSFDDLDQPAIRDFLKRANLDSSTDTMTILRNLALLSSEGMPANGAVLLFAGNLQALFPQAQVQCARFAGTSAVQFIDEATFGGPVLSQLDAALKFVTRNTRQAIHITGKAEHDIVPEYPVEAIREAIINAICHRAYTEPGMVQVRIFDNRLEVWNPGLLPPDLTIEALYHEHASHPRNPRLAQAFHRAGLVERWGTGTLRIITACSAHGMCRIEFASEGGVFKAQFILDTVVSKSFKLNERQQRAMEYIQQYGGITLREYQQVFTVGHSQAHRDLAELVSAGALIRDKHGRTSHYIRPIHPIA